MGYEPTDKQLASSLRMSRAELHTKMIECSLAREKLAMSNVRLVMSIAQKYDNMGTAMADLIQVNLHSTGFTVVLDLHVVTPAYKSFYCQTNCVCHRVA